MSSNCIFCKIVDGTECSTKYYEDEELVIFKDIKPGAKVHLLAVPKTHIPNINSLTIKDIPLVNKMIENGKQVILDQGGDVDDLLMGFHKPPFNTVSHLHLHLLSPRSELSLLSRTMFMANTLWFITVESLIEKLQSKL